MDIYNSQLVKEGADLKNDVVSQMALIPLMGFRMHLKESWPKLSRKVDIGFVKGTNGAELLFSHRLGWENEQWNSFVSNGIALPAALKNCQKGGIKKIVFYTKKEFKVFEVDELLKG